MDSANQRQPQHQQPAASQASSHFPLDPVSGAVLFEQEVRRRDQHAALGSLLTTGCRELDVEVLCSGGFERGCVVGISAEEEEFGLFLALQTLARGYVTAIRRARAKAVREDPDTGTSPGGEEETPRATVVTTLSMGALLPLLRHVFWGQLAAVGGKEEEEVDKVGLLRGFLERVEVARVFDVPGLWEVLRDLDRLAGEDDGSIPGTSQKSKREGEDVAHRGILGAELVEAKTRRLASEESNAEEEDASVHKLPSSSPLSDPPSSLPDEPPWEMTDVAEEALPRKTPPGRRTEIQDSEDEDEDEEDSSSLSPTEDAPNHPVNQPTEVASSGRAPPPVDDPDYGLLEDTSRQAATPAERSKATIPTNSTEGQPHSSNSLKRPDVIIITHISTLLSNLFQQREKSTAHQTLQLLSSHIRYLTRAPEHGGPLIMLLNSTTSSPSPSDNVNPTSAAPDRQDRPPPPPSDNLSVPPAPKALDQTLRSIFNPPPLPVSGLNYIYDTPHSRRNKPSFGLIFTQMLDMHLLCTRLPKTREDAEALYAPAAETSAPSTTKRPVAYGWVVEVLLDEIGIWEGRDAVERGRRRRSREQRWGAVEIRRDRKGVAIVDLFRTRDMSGEVIVAAGFGGRRV